MKSKHQTTAARLLEIIFQGHAIRTFFQDGKPLFIAADIAIACGISKAYDVIKNHVDSDQLTSISLEVRSANGTVQKRIFQCLTQSGVFALVMGSRKPAARRLQRWMADTVLPQLIELGTFIEGITPAERLAALHLRFKQEKAGQIENDTAWLAISGHLTIHDFGIEHDIPAAHKPDFGRWVQARARARGITPVKCYLRGQPRNPANVWPRELLVEARYAFYYPHLAYAPGGMETAPKLLPFTP